MRKTKEKNENKKARDLVPSLNPLHLDWVPRAPWRSPSNTSSIRGAENPGLERKRRDRGARLPVEQAPPESKAPTKASSFKNFFSVFFSLFDCTLEGKVIWAIDFGCCFYGFSLFFLLLDDLDDFRRVSFCWLYTPNWISELRLSLVHK